LGVSLRSVSDVTEHPDWSYLLAAVARALGDDVVLGAFDAVAAPAATNATTAAPAPSDGDLTPRRFTLTGVARSHAAVTQFVLRVESLRLFAKVSIAQAAPKPMRGADGIGFQLVCVLPDGDR
jgi:hypothetical protein